MAGQHPIWLFWVGIVALAALWWINRRSPGASTAGSTSGCAAAAIAVAVLTLLATVLAQSQSGDNDELRRRQLPGRGRRRRGSHRGQRRQGQREPAADQARRPARGVQDALGEGGRPASRSWPPRTRVTAWETYADAARARSSSWTTAATGTAPSRRPRRGTEDGASAALDARRPARHRPTPSRRPSRRPTTLRSGRTLRAGADHGDSLLGLRRGGALRLGHQPATQGVRMRTRRLLVGAAAVVLLAGCGEYADTAVPEPERRRPRRRSRSRPRRSRAATRPAPTRPTARVDDLRAGAVAELAAARTGWSSASPPTPTCSAPATRSPARSRASTSTWPRRSRDAIFGDDDKDHVQLRVITAADRIPLLQDQETGVDIVARNMTINCDRWEQIAFSAEYYRAGQKVLVRKDLAEEGIDTAAELAGLRVCAPDGHHQPGQHPGPSRPRPRSVTAANHTGCLVKFQRGEADAITGDDTVLAGLAAQDPYAVVPGAGRVHRRALRHRRQRRERGPGAVHQRGARGDARRRVLAGQLRQVAAADAGRGDRPAPAGATAAR